MTEEIVYLDKQPGRTCRISEGPSHRRYGLKRRWWAMRRRGGEKREERGKKKNVDSKNGFGVYS